MTNGKVIALDAVIFRKDLYPRQAVDPGKVQDYATSLEVLPPIELNQRNELIDGRHRWMAHKKQGAKEIAFYVTQTESDAALLELAIERNASHGLQLSQDDKRDLARRIYEATPTRDRDAKKKQLAKILSVPERTIRDWLSRMDKDAKEARDKRIFDLWLSCWTQEEIAEECDCDQKTASNVILGETAELPKFLKSHPSAEHRTDFEVPLYNVWKQQEKTPGSGHFGNSEVRWLDNLLYLYTEPFDVVVDPFAGGGSTIDLCKKRFRRYFASDRNPIVERDTEIRSHDVTTGLPPLPRWQDVKLVYLDPPYWKQAEGRYSKDPNDLANMELEAFHKTLAGLITDFSKKLQKYANEARIALLLQPTQWNAPDRQYTDHVSEMIRRVNLPIDLRVSAPYESQQCNAQMVKWAKDNRKVLVLTREFVVWRSE